MITWIAMVLLSFAIGWFAGKFDGARRMSKWLNSLGPGDQEIVRNLLRHSDQKPPH